MKIYTRTGDQGSTRLLSGKSVSKSDQRLNVYGTTDELNSWLGICQSHLPPPLKIDLTVIQNELFNLGSLLACDDPKFLPQLPKLQAVSIQRLEQEIDAMTADLPPLKNFILPGGSAASGFVHLARTVCRRAEREYALFSESAGELPTEFTQIGIYLNRLSDYLFVLARFLNKQANISDLEWKK